MDYDKSFIEVQFPVSKISKESYKERKAGSGQTLTGLGKWWGRKPLVLVRAALLGLLMPASDDPKNDMDIFLKIMSMDKQGLLNRRAKSISAKNAFEKLTTREREQYFALKNGELLPTWKNDIAASEKAIAIEKAWNRMSYDQKLTYCVRPEEYANEDSDLWEEINAHLGTSAANLQDLIKELGIMRFGKNPVVGDCFCGGGSVPFEAARMGCDVFASDLNPIAGLLTWASLNIAGVNNKEWEKIKDFHQKVYDKVDEQVKSWEIEENEYGEIADTYLYCYETRCPECGFKIPLLPTYVIRKGSRTIVNLIENDKESKYDFEVIENASKVEFEKANKNGTIADYKLVCPHCNKETPIPSIRRDANDGIIRPYRYNTPNSLRKWDKSDFMFHEDDIYNERLYGIRYIRNNPSESESKTYYASPSESDLKKEKKISKLLAERFINWQKSGILPSDPIEAGWNTNQLIYEKGFTYWHHLFNPRQLLIHGLFMEKIKELAVTNNEKVMGMLGINKLCNWNSKLCIIVTARESGGITQTFANQAFNTIFNYGTRAVKSLDEIWRININPVTLTINSQINLIDARNLSQYCDIWVTDPPYADAVNYHELAEFFLAWDKTMLKKAFPKWYTDSKRVLAVQGQDETFNNSMIDIYTNLAANMPDNGMQIIMFTHQDVGVWADLRNIVWAAGLQVTAAWTIATETESGGLKAGNYVKGTVLLVLRKRTSEKTAFLDEIMPEVEDEVKAQIRNMRHLDDIEEPNFTDADYILAAYAASLKVLTSYKNIEDIDVAYELSRVRKSGELSPVAQVIESAKKIAYDQLIPIEIDAYMWKALSAEERLYIKGLELEKNNVYQLSAYQELARGFGVNEYKDFMENVKANAARFKTPGEWAGRSVSGEGFAGTVLRHVFMALYLTSKDEDNVAAGKNWLKNEVPTYDGNGRKIIIELLGYITTFENMGNMSQWSKAAGIAAILKELVTNDGV